ncbi:MAG: TrkA family potassium uptake protein [Lachnospiraceae bacterium]|nr:TrkA family potassium uptake protein [Lachnospiraceae bacterium]
MKSILIIGMGRFGQHLCRNLAALENEIMIVDQEEERLEDMLPLVVSAKIGDCTNETVLKSLGIDNFDICFVCIGTNFQSSLEITSMLKEMGARYVVSKANRDIHAKFLLRNGADEVIYPDRDIAEKLAVRYSANHVFDYIELTDEFSIYEIPPLPEWVGKSLKELALRNVHHISILAVKRPDGEMCMMPDANYVILADDHLMVIGMNTDIQKLLDRIK